MKKIRQYILKSKETQGEDGGKSSIYPLPHKIRLIARRSGGPALTSNSMVARSKQNVALASAEL